MMTSNRYEVSKRGQAKCQPKSKTEQIMKRRGIETEICLVNQMNRMHASNFLFSIKVILVCKLRLAPNQALHVTSIYGVFGSSLLIESTDSTIPLPPVSDNRSCTCKAICGA